MKFLCALLSAACQHIEQRTIEEYAQQRFHIVSTIFVKISIHLNRQGLTPEYF
jgi:hypothetical protein